MDYYIEMLRKSIARIEADFEFSTIIDHNASKGTFREQIVQKFLRPFLPNAYGISGGQAFDLDGAISKQLDVVIYDALHSYVAPYMDDFITLKQYLPGSQKSADYPYQAFSYVFKLD